MKPFSNFRQKALEKDEGTRLWKVRQLQQLLEYENKASFRKQGFSWLVWQRWESDEGKHPDQTPPRAKGYLSSAKAQRTCSATAPQLVQARHRL